MILKGLHFPLPGSDTHTSSPAVIRHPMDYSHTVSEGDESVEDKRSRINFTTKSTK